jgi:hypothetical protein
VATGAAPALHDGGQAQRINWRRVALLTVAGLTILWACDQLYLAIASGGQAGGDFGLYQGAARRWLSGGGFYPAYQLAGPYDTLAQGDNPPILYPPVALLLFVPSLVLPGILWWAIPLGVTVWIVLNYRPNALAWLAIGFSLAFVPTLDTIFAGNPGMWVPLAVGLSLRHRWVAAFVLLKPSLFPFALLGVRHRGWGIVAGLIAVVSILMLPMDLDWLRATLNARGDRSGLFYSLRELPLDCIPLVAWAGRHRELIEATRERRG